MHIDWGAAFLIGSLFWMVMSAWEHLARDLKRDAPPGTLAIRLVLFIGSLGFLAAGVYLVLITA